MQEEPDFVGCTGVQAEAPVRVAADVLALSATLEVRGASGGGTRSGVDLMNQFRPKFTD
jgi:hypothetical protein